MKAPMLCLDCLNEWVGSEPTDEACPKCRSFHCVEVLNKTEIDGDASHSMTAAQMVKYLETNQ